MIDRNTQRDDRRLFCAALDGDPDALAEATRLLERRGIEQRAPTRYDYRRATSVLTRMVRPWFNVSAAEPFSALQDPLLDYSNVTSMENVDLYLNGMLLRGATGNDYRRDVLDWFPGDDPSIGDVKFSHRVGRNLPAPPVLDDILIMMAYVPVEYEDDASFQQRCLRAIRVLMGGNNA